MKQILQYGFGALLGLAGGIYIYNKRFSILAEGNMYYRGFNNFLNNLNPIKIIETIQLKSEKIYLIELLGKEFLVKDIEIDVSKYKTLRTSIVIPHTPDDILETICQTSNGEIDITDISRKLVGPFLTQFTEDNKNWIKEYLNMYHDIDHVNAINLTFINNSEINI